MRHHVIRRAAILFALGLLLNAIEAAPPLSLATFRIPGVLQRIAFVYLAVSWITEQTSTRTQVAIAIGALLGYWAALTWMPVPGCVRPMLSAECNIGSFVDRHVFGRHMLSPAWDPEGLLSTVPAIATALFGVFAGDWLQAPAARHRTLALFAAGAAAAVVALAWHQVFPINKNLWTSSFALFTAGLAAQVIAVCHWLLDIRHWRTWSRPFVAFGRNPLIGYFLSVGFDALLTRWSTPQHVTIKGSSIAERSCRDCARAAATKRRRSATRSPTSHCGRWSSARCTGGGSISGYDAASCRRSVVHALPSLRSPR